MSHMHILGFDEESAPNYLEEIPRMSVATPQISDPMAGTPLSAESNLLLMWGTYTEPAPRVA